MDDFVTISGKITSQVREDITREISAPPEISNIVIEYAGINERYILLMALSIKIPGHSVWITQPGERRRFSPTYTIHLGKRKKESNVFIRIKNNQSAQKEDWLNFWIDFERAYGFVRNNSYIDIGMHLGSICYDKHMLNLGKVEKLGRECLKIILIHAEVLLWRLTRKNDQYETTAAVYRRLAARRSSLSK